MAPTAQPNGVIGTLVICTGLSLLGDATMYTVLPSQYTALGLLTVHVGWILSANRLVRVPLNLISGWLADRLGGRAPYLVGLGLGACSTLGYGLTSSLWVLLSLRILWGIAWALLVVASFKMVLDATTERNRGLAMSVYNSAAFLIGAAGALLGGLLTDRLGFRPAMLVLGVLSGAGVASLTAVAGSFAKLGTDLRQNP